MWIKVYINAQSVQHKTGAAVLINMPRSSNYAGYKFFHPIKLIKNEGGKGYYISILFTKNFIFKLKRYGKGKYNKYDVIETIEITADEFSLEFADTIKTHIEREESKNNDSYLKIQEPDKINKNVELYGELINE